MNNLQIIDLYKKCKRSESSFIIVLIRFFWNLIIYKKKLLLHQHVSIKKKKNLIVNELVKIGVGQVGFSMRTDRTLLNLKGKLNIKGKYSIGRGCRFDIGEEGNVEIGLGGYINCNTTLIIMHQLKIGDNCVISWDCQFLDEDFHEISYLGKKTNQNSIIIGNNVWIGCGTKIYKGTIIPDGCVIAANSIVKGVFNTSSSLIGGNPAKVIKENITWK